MDAGTVHDCAKPLYLSVDVGNAEDVIRSADNVIVLFSECLMSKDEMEYIVKAINFYERYKLLDGTR